MKNSDDTINALPKAVDALKGKNEGSLFAEAMQ